MRLTLILLSKKDFIPLVLSADYVQIAFLHFVIGMRQRFFLNFAVLNYFNIVGASPNLRGVVVDVFVQLFLPLHNNY